MEMKIILLISTAYHDLSFSLAIILMGVFVDLEKNNLIQILSLLGGVIILLFLGIKDDLLVLSPKKKIIGQFFSALLVILGTDNRITDFYGIFGIGELPYIFYDEWRNALCAYLLHINRRTSWVFKVQSLP